MHQTGNPQYPLMWDPEPKAIPRAGVSVTGIVVAVVCTLCVAVGAAAVVVFVIYKRGGCSQTKGQTKGSESTLKDRPQPIIHTVSGGNVKLFGNMTKTKEKANVLEEIPRKNIRFQNTIGRGAFGTVVKAEVLNLKRTRGCGAKRWTTVAVKMTLVSEDQREESRRDFLAELGIMRSLPPHVNIVTLYASCTAHDPYLMLLEFAERGDLKRHLQDQRMERNYANAAFCSYGLKQDSAQYITATRATPIRVDGIDNTEVLTSQTLMSYALQVCRGLRHLANNKIVHRDVAARNMLLYSHHVVKISDFGLARHIGPDDEYTRTRKGLLPVRWMSPESLFYNQYSQMSDVWSFGVFVWELVTLGSTPFAGLDTEKVLDVIKAGQLLTCPGHSSGIVNELMLKCWKTSPIERPTFAELCGHLEKLLESQVEYVDLDQMDDHEYSTLDD
ncbi:tyrosine kinase receptor Cad96Ca-like [Physella acuta]|uniref:tyrosine kinase receptor Cad96Ca-like n=1 Tax=Physella acuta TaxID=109671 RepID=UPI0027DBF8D2|nr:tyrosine kinase receptor Cad96Ca-like [Physella acuta]